jgi:hypothetical protein
LRLLEKVIRASGGLDVWRLTRRFTLHMSISGSICSAGGRPAELLALVVEGSTQIQALEINGFARPDQRVLYRTDKVVLEGQDPGSLLERLGSPDELRGELRVLIWNELQLAYYCGYLIWNYIATPFMFAEPDFETTELPGHPADKERLQRIEVRFPAHIVTHASTQTFSFDEEGYLRRLDYPATQDGRTQLAQFYSGHQRFSKILVPTLCRILSIGPHGNPILKPPLLDIEIFDARFE